MHAWYILPGLKQIMVGHLVITQAHPGIPTIPTVIVVIPPAHTLTWGCYRCATSHEPALAGSMHGIHLLQAPTAGTCCRASPRPHLHMHHPHPVMLSL